MTERNVRFVKGLYRAFAEGDVGTVLAGMHPDIIWNEAENFPYADGNPYVGPEGVAEGLFRRLGEEWEYWNLELEDFIAGEDRVVARGRYRAKNRATGIEIDAQFAHVWWIEDGKVRRFQQYADTAQVRDAVTGG